MKKEQPPSIPVEVRLTERQYRVLHPATKHRMKPDEMITERVTESIERIYIDGIHKYWVLPAFSKGETGPAANEVSYRNTLAAGYVHYDQFQLYNLGDVLL